MKQQNDGRRRTGISGLLVLTGAILSGLLARPAAADRLQLEQDRLDRISAQTANGTPVATSASNNADPLVLPPDTNTPVVLVVTATPASSADDLLRPADGGAASGGVPVFDAGPADGMQPDKLEPNDSFDQAVAINVGAVYQHLNFVPLAGAAADGDFYSFRAKPGLCYAIATGDLSAGLDTTILLWQAGVTREARKLVAQNDDARPKTADLSSLVRWCSFVDSFMVVEIHNYGWAPQTDPRGKSYSLAILIDPPTPTATAAPTRTPRPADTGAAAIPGGAGVGAAVGSGYGNVTGAGATTPTWTATARPTASSTATATATPTPSLTTTTTATAELAGVVSSTSAGSTKTPTMTVTATATATPVPTGVADLTCYLDLNQNEAPDPGEGITGLRGVVIDTTTNAIITEASSDTNGHIHLIWPGRASVRIALPDLGWNQEVLAGQLQRAKDEPIGGGHWSADVRVKAPTLPGILP